MKKLFLTSLAVLLFFGVALASEDNKTIINAVQLDNDPTSVNSTTVNIQNYKKVGIVTNYNETEVGNSVSGSFTIDFSYDGTNFFDGYFLDWVGGQSTLQTSETLSSDGWYWAWLDPNWSLPPYLRVNFAGTNTDSDDIIVISVYLVGVK